jgi:hypothetical protein
MGVSLGQGDRRSDLNPPARRGPDTNTERADCRARELNPRRPLFTLPSSSGSRAKSSPCAELVPSERLGGGSRTIPRCDRWHRTLSRRNREPLPLPAMSNAETTASEPLHTVPAAFRARLTCAGRAAADPTQWRRSRNSRAPPAASGRLLDPAWSASGWIDRRSGNGASKPPSRYRGAFL